MANGILLIYIIKYKFFKDKEILQLSAFEISHLETLLHVLQHGKAKAWEQTDWGIEVNVDKELANVTPADYDALVLPGGVMNPDKLRQNEDAVNFVKEFLQSGKPIAAICHGPQILIETGLLKGKTMTSFPSLQTDLRNAGVNWVDKEIVHFDNLITSRKPSDLDAFNEELIKTLS